MSQVATRAQNSSTDKFAARRHELAQAALAAVAEQGFANTGMRDVASRAQLSHGSLHYYFDGKDDLIGQAIWQYKSECARRYDEIVASSASGSELIQRFGAEMASTLRDEAPLHRLWYDLRNQAMFQTGFGETITAIDGLLRDMVWAVVERYSALEAKPPRVDSEFAYALFDGVFQSSLLALLRGQEDAPATLSDHAGRLLASTL